MNNFTEPTVFAFWRNSLAGKFVMVTILVVFILMGISAYVNYQSQKSTIFTNIRTQSQMLGSFVSSISPHALLSYDFDELNDYMIEISRGEDIVYAVIVSPEGKPMTSHLDQRNQYISNHLVVNSEIDIQSLITEVSKHDSVIQQSFPIIFENKILGYFKLGISKDRMEEIITEKLIIQIIMSLIFTLLLGICVYLIFRYYTMRPIRQLVQGAQRIASGKLNKEVTVLAGDELGHLSQSFNQMMQKLKLNISEKDIALKTVQELNQSLEERVDERTRALEAANRKLEVLAHNDSLTSLPNRFSIQIRLSKCIAEAKRAGSAFSVIMLDLDRFKEINDSMGHDCGDQLLIEVSFRLKDILRPSDTIGRLGGDEFAILLPDTDESGAKIVANKVHQALENSFYLADMAFSISASIGIAIYPRHGNSSSKLLKAADVAMYYAKNNRIGLFVYNPMADRNTPDRLNLMGELRQAIHQDQLQLYFQPKVDLAQEKIIGVEALLRWNHPERGFIPPDEFIPLAEQSGLIRPLTYWVIDNALQRLDSWHKAGIYVSVSINLSMHNLQDPDFPAQLKLLLRSIPVGNNYIQFEITESAVMNNTEYVMEVLRNLGELDVSFAIDDFGTGYSSLSMLKKLPVHELKIDKSFVMDMASDSDDEAIVHSVIDMGHTLGLKVIAEGVESAVVMHRLIRLGCDMIQGYYVSRPLPAEEITPMLRKMHWKVVPNNTSNVTELNKKI